MKIKLSILTLILCAMSAQATLIDLIPGGFHWDQNSTPQLVKDWYNTTRLKVLLWYPNEEFFTVTGLGTPALTLSWNFASPATFQWIFVSHGDLTNFYQVTGIQSHYGETTFSFDGLTPIDGFIAFGHPPNFVPDAGFSLGLFGLAIAILASIGRWLWNWNINDTVRRAHRKLKI